MQLICCFKKLIFSGLLVFPLTSLAITSNLSQDLDGAQERLFELNGFLTASAGITNAKDVIYPVVGTLKPEYDDIGNKINFNSDSVAGLQFFFPFKNNFSATIQLLAEGKRQYKVQTAWAYVKWEPNANVSVLFGRFRTPAFLFSDLLNVGYAYPWIKPPAELYSRATANLSGITPTIKETLFDEWECVLQPVFAADDDTINIAGQNITTKVRNVWGAVGRISNEWFTLQSSYFISKITFEGLDVIAQFSPLGQNFLNINNVNPQLALLYTMLGTNGPAIQKIFAEQYKINDRRVRYLNIGTNIRYRDLLILAEWNYQTIVNSIIGGYRTYYVTVGYKVCKFLPNFTFSSIRTLHKSDHTKPGAAIKSAFGGMASADLINGIDDFTKSLFDTDQDSMILGLRYDVNENIALKISDTAIRLRNNTKGLFSVKPRQNWVNLVSCAVNVVF